MAQETRGGCDVTVQELKELTAKHQSLAVGQKVWVQYPEGDIQGELLAREGRSNVYVVKTELGTIRVHVNGIAQSANAEKPQPANEPKEERQKQKEA